MTDNLRNVYAMFSGTIWAIEPNKGREIAALAETIAQGERNPNYPSSEVAEPYVLENGVAVVPIRNVMMKRGNMFMKVSGGTSTELLTTQIARIAAMDGVKAIVFDVDSPGGSVEGLSELRDTIRAIEKPTIAVANDAMFSAAYFVGSSADRVFASKDALVGSIGTIASRVDLSEHLAEKGIKEHVWRSGDFKALGRSSEPLSDKESNETSKLVNHYFGVFRQTVAENRNLTDEQVNAVADGRIFTASEALELNLIDGVKTLSEVLDMAGVEASDAEKVDALTEEYKMAQEENATLRAQLEALEAEGKTKAEEARKLAVDAAVTKLIEGDKKVKPGMEAKLRERLNSDLEGTLAAYELVPVGAAAPAGMEQVELDDSVPAVSQSENEKLLAAAEADPNVGVAENEDEASVFAQLGVSHLRAFGDKYEQVDY